MTNWNKKGTYLNGYNTTQKTDETNMDLELLGYMTKINAIKFRDFTNKCEACTT